MVCKYWAPHPWLARAWDSIVIRDVPIPNPGVLLTFQDTKQSKVLVIENANTWVSKLPEKARARLLDVRVLQGNEFGCMVWFMTMASQSQGIPHVIMTKTLLIHMPLANQSIRAYISPKAFWHPPKIIQVYVKQNSTIYLTTPWQTVRPDVRSRVNLNQKSCNYFPLNLWKETPTSLGQKKPSFCGSFPKDMWSLPALRISVS